jgi:hypothetical protein
MQINNAVVAEAELDAGLSGFETTHFFTLSTNENGQPSLLTADSGTNVASVLNASQTDVAPVRDGYQGYLISDGITPNLDPGQFGFGIQFPRSPVDGDTFLRTDYLPNRLFRWNGSKWIKQEDNVRMTLSNTDDRQTLKTSFINNDKLSGISKVGSDTVSIDADKNPIFNAGEGTVNFYMSTDSFYILTNIVKQPNMVVEVWLDEESRATDITLTDSNGFLAFTVNHPILASTIIRWSVYDQTVEQRQSLSKALRKLKPTADE